MEQRVGTRLDVQVGSIRFTSDHDPSARSLIRRVLDATGIVEVARTIGGTLPELVVAAGVTREALGLVQSLSHGGLVRVLAVMTAPGASASEASWRLVGAGASDVVAWDMTAAGAADVIAAKLERWAAIDAIAASDAVRDSLVGEGPEWMVLLREIVEVARFTDASVLITGESGTGKELVARLIHDLDPRPTKGDLVVLDCTTVVPTLSGSEFFGHEKGAYTGATATRDGAFAMADGGTLFLDEVGDLQVPLQAELLRGIQEGMYKRVGSNTWRATRFRLVCATNRDLRVDQEAGRFRSDLFYRIAEWQFHLPALRERTADIPLLTRAFLRQAHPAGAVLAIDEPVARLLASREYPGNIRDLRQFVYRISKRHVGSGPITVGDVPPGERLPVSSEPTRVPAGVPTDQGTDDLDLSIDRHAAFNAAARAAVEAGKTLAEIKEQAVEAAIEAAMASEGTTSGAAQRLGVTVRALQLRKAAGRAAPGSAPIARPVDDPEPGRPAHR